MGPAAPSAQTTRPGASVDEPVLYVLDVRTDEDVPLRVRSFVPKASHDVPSSLGPALIQMAGFRPDRQPQIEREFPANSATLSVASMVGIRPAEISSAHGLGVLQLAPDGLVVIRAHVLTLHSTVCSAFEIEAVRRGWPTWRAAFTGLCGPLAKLRVILDICAKLIHPQSNVGNRQVDRLC